MESYRNVKMKILTTITLVKSEKLTRFETKNHTPLVEKTLESLEKLDWNGSLNVKYLFGFLYT